MPAGCVPLLLRRDLLQGTFARCLRAARSYSTEYKLCLKPEVPFLTKICDVLQTWPLLIASIFVMPGRIVELLDPVITLPGAMSFLPATKVVNGIPSPKSMFSEKATAASMSVLNRSRSGCPSALLLKLCTVGKLQPDDATNYDCKPEGLDQGEGLVEQDTAKKGRANRTDASPHGITDPHIYRS